MRLSRIAPLLIVALSLSGCSPVTASGANQEATPAASVQEENISREAFRRNTNVCIQNDSSQQLRVLWRGYPDFRYIAPGARNCNSGRGSETVDDVVAELDHEMPGTPGTWFTWFLFANNGYVFLPEAGAWYKAAGDDFGICGEYEVGDTNVMQADLIRGEMTRLSDSADNKEFLFRVSDATGGNIATILGSCAADKHIHGGLLG